MQAKKPYIPGKMADAERFLENLFKLPKERRSMVIMAANAFIAGMEAQEQLSNQQHRPGGAGA